MSSRSIMWRSRAPGQPGLRKRIADLALHNRPLDGIVSIVVAPMLAALI
jgi:hypothetical protein